jgi:hypothetical protein
MCIEAMKIIKNESTKERRLLKIGGIILFIVISYVMVHHVSNEVYFQRFPNIFVAFIEMYLNKRISLDYFSLAPLFSSGVQIDPSLSSRAQGIMITESHFPNFVMLFLFLHYITGLSPQLLVVLPLGILFVPITYLALVKTYIPAKNNSDYLFQFLLAIYIIIYLVSTKFYGSFYGAQTALLLILILFLCIKKFCEENSKRRVYYLLICISTLSLAHYWHSALMIILFFIISLWIVSGLFYSFTAIPTKFANIKWKEDMKIIFSRSTSLFVTSVIISLTFMHLWHTPYIGEFLGTAGLFDFLSKALVKLFGGNPFPIPYAFSYKNLFWGKIYFITLLLIYILSTLVLIVPLLLHILQFIRKKMRETTLPLIFGLAIILAQIINVIAYYNTASINFFYVPLFFPIFGVYLLINTVSNKKEKLEKIIIFGLILMCILSSLCNVSIYLTNEAGATSVTKYEDTRSSFEWLYSNRDKDKGIGVDFNILGKYLQREAEISKPSIDYYNIDTYTYSVLVGDNEDISKHLTKNYAVIDHATMSKGLPIHITECRGLLIPLLEPINNCTSHDKIYEDSYISIFLFK